MASYATTRLGARPTCALAGQQEGSPSKGNQAQATKQPTTKRRHWLAVCLFAFACLCGEAWARALDAPLWRRLQLRDKAAARRRSSKGASDTSSATLPVVAARRQSSKGASDTSSATLPVVRTGTVVAGSRQLRDKAAAAAQAPLAGPLPLRSSAAAVPRCWCWPFAVLAVVDCGGCCAEYELRLLVGLVASTIPTDKAPVPIRTRKISRFGLAQYRRG